VRFIVAGLCVLSFGPLSTAAQCRYSWTEIPRWGWPQYWPWVTGMNDVGQVVGYFVAAESSVGFVWSEAEGMQLLPRPPGHNIVEPADINDSGEVVCHAEDSIRHFAFYWNGGDTYIDLGLPPGGNLADAHAINNNGQIVGTWGNNNIGPWHAFIWENGVATDVSHLLNSPQNFGYDINENGSATGVLYYFPAWEQDRGFVLDDTQVSALPPAPECITSDGRAINDRGDVCGRGRSGVPSDPDFHYCGFVWLDQQIHAVPRRPGEQHVILRDINSSGVAVGAWEDPGGIGFVWQDGVARRLSSRIVNGPSSSSHLPMAIDSSGRIAAVVGSRIGILTPIAEPGDASGDCRVDIRDLAIVLATFGCAGTACEGDLDADGAVGLADLAILLTHFGT